MIINFNDFITERMDISKSKFLLKIAQDILDKYLDKVKKLIENNEQENVHKQDPKFNTLEYDDYKIMFLANYGAAGELFIKEKIIYISNEIVDIINSLKNKTKKQALDIFNNLTLNKELLNQTIYILVHEYGHKEDPYNYEKEDNYTRKLDKIRIQLKTEFNDELKSKSDKLYYNLSTEYNSFFITFCAQLIDIVEDDKDFLHKNNFEKILDLFKKSNVNLFNNINVKNKKRLINRLFDFYLELKKL